MRRSRLAAHGAVGTALSLLSDRRLAEVVASGVPLGSGVGGRSVELDVDGTRVFVKRVPLTDLELRPAHARSTANLFDLPLFYQYGIGSSGFGAWRELATHIMTTNWVIGDADAYPGFPLLYHWRVLPDSRPDGFMDEFGGIDKAVAHWDGSPAVRRRLEAIGRSTAALVLFMEHVPRTLGAWLGDRRAVPPVEGQASPYLWAESVLTRGADFMSARGLVHFDAHFRNVLTDGRLIYFADFGLALSSHFELAPAETDFLADHLSYDRCYITTHLLRHHLLDGERDCARHARLLRDWPAGRRPEGVRADVATLVGRHAGSALVLEDFHRRLLKESRLTPFPRAEVERALRTATS
ncbi:protein kinase family protein [Streptomyces camponoticapitis]|uniref:protein kinase family protein n=1 Tax=Streptomyces camponoticapitis TaxID=1616125 RepID=UPI0016674E51|nr:protein kinase family protein [Streptomyces camponoticapitis]